jgi:glutaredoxin-related protein
MMMSSLTDRIRARAHRAIDSLPGKLGDAARKANEALGRPLADEHELADRRAFDARTGGARAGAAGAKPAPPAGSSAGAASAEHAPVIIYYMDKQKRDVSKLTDVLDTQGVQYTVTNIQEDPAAQFAVRRDSKGHRLPVVFIAGDCVGGRAELVNLASSGELKKKVTGG